MPTSGGNAAWRYILFTAGLSLVASAGIFAAGVIGHVQSLPPTVRVVRGTLPLTPQILGETTAAPVDALIRGSFSAIYYAAADGFRYVFPNEKTFGSWFRDYGQIITVADDVLAQIPLKGNVTYRPGVRLVKLQTSPVVYAVDAGGTLRALPNEATAAALYGLDWASKVDDLPDVFFVNYQLGEPIVAPAAFDPGLAVANAPTINQDRGLPVTANAPVATTVVGSSTIPLPHRVIGRPVAPEEPATSTPRLPEEPVPPPPTSTATSTPETSCPLGQTYATAQRRCLPTHARDSRCGGNGYRDRFGGCFQLPRGRFPVADWAICGDKNCDLERGENAVNCLADCPGIFPPGYSTSTPTTTPSGATPATPAQPATPAAPATSASGGTATTPAAPAVPATPATPAIPATPATPPTTSTTTATSTPPTADTTAPGFSNLLTTAVTDTGATITWTTDEPATSQVEYGSTINYGFETTLNQTLVTSHTVNLTGLTASTKYYYRAKSQDASGNLAVVGSYFMENFTTLTPSTANTTLPVISNIQVSSITYSDATITWTTDIPSTSEVRYLTWAGTLAPDLPYGPIQRGEWGTSHSVKITPLGTPSIGSLTYYFIVISKDSSGSLVSASAEMSFATAIPQPIPGNSLTVLRTFPGEYDNTKYIVVWADPDGIKFNETRKADGSVWTSGFPPCLTKYNSGTSTFQPANFPLSATITDCANPSNTYTVTAGMPPLP